MAKKTDKTCIVCGSVFQGTAKAKVCTQNSNCRVQLKRILDKGGQPPFLASPKIAAAPPPTAVNSGNKNESKKPDKSAVYPASFVELLAAAKSGVPDVEEFKKWVMGSKLLPNQKSMVLSKIKAAS